jgi:hypothetical protein
VSLESRPYIVHGIENSPPSAATQTIEQNDFPNNSAIVFFHFILEMTFRKPCRVASLYYVTIIQLIQDDPKEASSRIQQISDMLMEDIRRLHNVAGA